MKTPISNTIFLLLITFLISCSSWNSGERYLASGEKETSVTALVQSGTTEGEILSGKNYEDFNVVALDNPKSIFVNRSVIEGLGVDTSHMSEDELNDAASKSFGWVSEQMLPAESRDMAVAQADYYGGTGMGYHKGSARAGIMGKVQIKGIGITPLYSGSHGGKHDGKAGFHEAIKEVVWGNLLDNELTYGANKVVALVDTGLKKSDGESHVLIVRENPIRAGHFVRRTYGSDSADDLRVSDNLTQLERAVGDAHENDHLFDQYLKDSAPEKFKSAARASEAWLNKVSKQVARTYVRRMFHGATSESNININGEFIDYGTASTNSGYGRISFLSHVEPFGEFDEVKKLWGPGIAIRFFKNVGTIDRLWFVSGRLNGILDEIWMKSFSRSLTEEFLMVLGVPKGSVNTIKAMPEAQDLARRLFYLTKKSSTSSFIDIQNGTMPENTSQIDFPKLFNLLAASADEPAELDQFLRSQLYISEDEAGLLKEQFAKVYQGVRSDLEKKGIDPGQTSKVMKLNATWLNRDLPELYINNFRSFTGELAEEYKSGKPMGEIVQKIRSLIARNTKEIKGLPDDVIPMSLDENLKLKTYNSRTQTVEYHQLDVTSGKMSLKAEDCSTLLLRVVE
jgi:hypothetical protein